MTEDVEVNYSKSVGDLGREALWFLGHTLIAIATLLLILLAGILLGASQDDFTSKLIGTAMAIVLPAVVGFLIAKMLGNEIGRYTWISGLLFFSVLCVWVLDLPTGPGLCEHCGAMDKLWRTFFDIRHGSGLLGGDGLAGGTWVPLALFGYAIGATLGLSNKAEA